MTNEKLNFLMDKKSELEYYVNILEGIDDANAYNGRKLVVTIIKEDISFFEKYYREKYTKLFNEFKEL